MKLPIVALCGRPNVGKSTLFNRLTRSRAALVHDLPGMTRDRSYGRVTCLDEAGDPTEVFELVDTGGLDFDGADVITMGITRIAEAAMQEAHVLVLMVDAHDGWNPDDAEIAGRIRVQGKPSILVINKIDGVRGGSPDSAFYELGFDEVHILSSAHGDGVPELLASIQAHLPFHRSPEEAEIHDPGDELRFAVIGRPNVGKSSLVNKFLGYERSLVSDVAGTTRDTVDTVFQVEERIYRLIDTAGIRRKGKTNEGAEKLSILKAKQAMARADVSLLLVDAVEGVTHQDAVIAGYAQDAGAAVIILVNKWDLVEKDTFTSLAMEDRIRQDLGFLQHSPMMFVSALTGQRVSKVFTLIHEVADAHARRIPTGKLNTFLREAVSNFPPAAVEGLKPKLYFMTQVGVRPPSFVIKTNTDREMHFSYQRYLENRLREQFGFVGTPIRLAFRKRGVGEGQDEGTAKVRKILDPGEGLKPSRSAEAKAHASQGPTARTFRRPEGEAAQARPPRPARAKAAKPATARPTRTPKAAPAKGRASRGVKGLSATRPGQSAKRQVSKKK
ncbi:ribosome biogenesis GTPase Der [Mesoterricola silvestris]|uniref:GTPase Der n=1 Tax=Mesoterricola silvestris TaxID=2927979 RepID=A0AA48K7H4_9BACT|nr:ribosome biogenesis GTPase Der [Mesoterricola silvestris]BDU71150.1 GTPase Der [Mesoterricola silvestris]